MRISRSHQLYLPSAAVHFMWRCHNKEHYLRSLMIKALYMLAVRESLKKNKNVFIHAYCVMDNHYHQSVSYDETSEYLSNYMRYAHSLFGSRYNKLSQRSGKVAESRPKTCLIENTEHEMRVHFYIEANPIRAKMYTPEELKNYKYNSFRYYAYGIKDDSDILRDPEWYTKLGKTPGERQRKYRKLFYAYLREQDLLKSNFETAYIGSPIWVNEQRRRISSLLQSADTS